MAPTITEKPVDLLERIEDLSNSVKSFGKKTQQKKQFVDTLLDVLDDLIRLSADRFMSLGDTVHFEIQDDEYEQYIVHPDDIIRAKSFSSSILLKLISADLLFEDDRDDERIERASRLLAHMSGRGGTL